MTYVRDDWFYDMEVPGTENYLAHGIWNHNTKKTFSLDAILAALSNAYDPISKTKLDRPYRGMFLHKGGTEAAPGTGDNTDEKLNTIYRANGGVGELLCADVERFDSAGLALLQETILDEKIDILVVDYLFQYISGLVRNINDPAEVLPLAGSLNRVARTTNCCFVLLRHTSKAGGKETRSPSELGMGTNQWHDVFRGHLVYRKHPDAEHQKRGVVVVQDVKGDLLNPQGETFLFSREQNEIRWETELPDPFAAGSGTKSDTEPTSKVDACRAKLRELLFGQYRSAAQVNDLMEEAGFSERTVKRARALENVQSTKLGAAGGWSLHIPDPNYVDPFGDETND